MAESNAKTDGSYQTPVAIDWGTTNTVISFIKEGSSTPEILKSRTNDDLHPSATYINPDPNKPNLYGKAALGKVPDGNVILCPKRTIGARSSKIIANKQVDSFNATMATTGQAYPKFQIKRMEKDGEIKDVTIEAKKVIIDQLTYFRNLIEGQLGPNVAFVVTVPENWGNVPIDEMKKHLEKAGFTNLVGLISEPGGAQFAYRASQESSNDQFLVIDIGDGTTDISLLKELSPGEYKTIALGGSEKLGSRDIDIAFLNRLEEEAKLEVDFNPEAFKLQKRMLLSRMKEMKERLSESPEVTETVYGITGAKPFEFKVDSAKKYEILEAPFYGKLMAAINDVFTGKAAACETFTAQELKEGVNVIYLAGGGSKDPVVGDRIVPEVLPGVQILGQYGKVGTINPDIVVSWGAAYWCASQMSVPLEFGLPMKAVHWRVLPKDLGVDCTPKTGLHSEGDEDGWFRVIMKKQSVVPNSVGGTIFTTTLINQPNFEVRVLEGEGERTSNPNVDQIGVYSVPLKVPNKFPKIEVIFEVDSNGILKITAGALGQEYKEMTLKLEHSD